MYHVLNNIRRSNVTGHLLTLALVVSSAAVTQAALINTPGLKTVRIWESTGPFIAYDFLKLNPRLFQQLGVGTLGPNPNNDFSPLVDENYDVFYSDASGNLDPNGDCVTVEAVFPHALPSGGGLNLGAVDLVFNNNTTLRADVLASWVSLGNNYILGSEVFAVDADTPIPSTDTTMGSTTIPPTQHLRVTVCWSMLPVPEPSTVALGALGLLGMLVRRKPARAQ